MAPILVLVWVLSVCVAALDTVLGLAFVFLPCCLVLVPCQLYLYVVASRHYRSPGDTSHHEAGRSSNTRDFVIAGQDVY